MPWTTTLEVLWKQTIGSHEKHDFNDSSTWNKEIEALYRLGISMVNALRYLYFERPVFEEFKFWIESNKRKILLSV